MLLQSTFESSPPCLKKISELRPGCNVGVKRRRTQVTSLLYTLPEAQCWLRRLKTHFFFSFLWERVRRLIAHSVRQCRFPRSKKRTLRIKKTPTISDRLPTHFSPLNKPQHDRMHPHTNTTPTPNKHRHHKLKDINRPDRGEGEKKPPRVLYKVADMDRRSKGGGVEGWGRGKGKEEADPDDTSE